MLTSSKSEILKEWVVWRFFYASVNKMMNPGVVYTFTFSIFRSVCRAFVLYIRSFLVSNFISLFCKI